MTFNENQEPEKKDIYDQMAREEPERDLELDEGEEETRAKSLTEVEDESPNLSDLQVTLKRMFPKFADPYVNKVAQAVMIARITPDTILDRIYLTVIAIIEKQEVDGVDIDVMMTINLVTTAFEIGLDAKGRIDAIQLSSSAKEAEELESLSRTMGV